MRIWRAVVIAALLGAASCGQSATTEEQAAPAPSVDAGGGPTIFCEEVGRRISQQDCDDFNALARDAQAGVAAFNAPKDMRRGETHTLQLAISYAPPQVQIAPPVSAQTPTEDAPAANEEMPPPPAPAMADDEHAVRREDAASGPGGVTAAQAGPPRAQTPAETVEGLPGDTVQFTPLVGRFMKADLTGVGFDITAASPATQEVTKDGVTTWSWRVVAREGGIRSLTLTTVVQGCTAQGECVPLRTTTQNYTVSVSVSPIDKVRDFLVGAPDWLKIITAVIVALTSLIAAIFGLRAAIRKGRSGA
ncbi:MAG TPA: hypothetical protein VG841_09205 [Caulobacterales bacterium]|nr:hypothetical protein [Caulobacterales bacterium]